MADAARRQHGPAPVAAADIGADTLRRQEVPGKDRKIAIEHRAAICVGQIGFRLRERRPFAAEPFDRRRIGIFWKRCHCKSRSQRGSGG